MALSTPTALTSFSIATDAHAYSTSSVSVSTGDLVVAFVTGGLNSGGGVAPASISGTLGGSLTWTVCHGTQAGSVDADATMNSTAGARTVAYWAVAPSNLTGIITFNYTPLMGNAMGDVLTFTGADTTNPIRFSQTEVSGAANPSMTLTVAPLSTSCVVACWHYNSAQVATAGTGFTLIGTQTTQGTPTLIQASQYRAGSTSTTVGQTHIANNHGGVAVEVIASTGTSATVNATTATGTGAGQAPTVTAGSAVTPPAATGTGQAQTPTPSAGSTVSPPAAAGTGQGQAPTVAAGSTVSPPVATGTGQGQVPAPHADSSVTPPAATGTGQGRVPAVSGGSTVTPPAATGTGAAQAPAPSASSTVTPPAVTGTGAAPAPTVTGGSGTVDQTVNPPAATGTGTAKTPAVSAGSTVTPPAAAGTGTGKAPSVSTGATEAPPAATGTGTGQPPTVSASATVQAPTATGTGQALPPADTAGPTGHRFLIVPAAHHTLDVPAEFTPTGTGDDRTLVIEATRVITVAAEPTTPTPTAPRTVTVPKQNRQLEVVV